VVGRRVVVTGFGQISALGRDRHEFWQALAQGRSGIGPIEGVDCASLHFQNGAQVRRFDPLEYFPDPGAEWLDRFAQFAVIAAREAMQMARLPSDRQRQDRVAVVTGSGMGGQAAIEQGYVELYRNGGRRVHPLSIPRIMANAGASYISMEFGITGPAFTLSTACSSASHAIGHAYWMVRHGMVDRAITGGSEAPFGFGNLKAWDALRVVAPDTCRPFSRDRRGVLLGEGGAMLVIESLESALGRDCPIHAEIVGFGMSSDAHHVTQPSPEGPALAMQAALRDGSIRPEQVGYINAHGTGTRANDQVETVAIRKVFGTHADRLAVSSTKSMHGHALGAAGAIEAIATVLALQAGLVPPTANFTSPDPACDLDVVPNEARPLDVEYALSNSFAFGGLNVALALRRWNA
jgi:nodulation protein E